MSTKTLIKSIVVLSVICLVISGALAVVNSFTAPVIEAAAIQRENASRQAALPAAADFEAITEGLTANVVSAYKGVDASGATVGYVLTSEGKGFNGTIQVMTAVGVDGKIVGVTTLDVSGETATLGGKTKNESYTSMYIGTDATLEGVDVISGATITSEAYEQAVVDAMAAYEAVKEG